MVIKNTSIFLVVFKEKVVHAFWTHDKQVRETKPLEQVRLERDQEEKRIKLRKIT